MKVGLLITSVGEFGQTGFYNSQEIGLAKELELLVHEIVIYKAVAITKEYIRNKIEDCRNTTLIQIPVKSRGANGVWDCSVMDSNLDALIYFSDTQLAVPKVYRWCRKNQVVLYPYIGVVESHSTNKIKKFVMDRLFCRNVRVYRKCTCFVKTPYIKTILRHQRIKKMRLAPVGLDVTLLRKDYADHAIEELRKKWEYSDGEKILLFVGRMTKEKRPLEMIELFQKIYKKNKKYRLIMVGKGELTDQVKKAAEGMEDVIRFFEQIPNQDMWELYRIADCFVNLNRQEIFGMAILEAMYYGCKVVAWKAPGPELIIKDGVSGYIATKKRDLCRKIIEGRRIPCAAHKRVISYFTWERTAKAMSEMLKEKNREK